MLNLAETHVMSLEPYVPGRSIESDSKISTWAKLGSNENCLGPSKAAIEAGQEALKSAHLYPNAKRVLVVHQICRYYKDFVVKSENVALGNGTSEIIVNLVRALIGADESLLYGWPSFIVYRLAAHAQGRKHIGVPLKNDLSYDLAQMLEQIHKPSQKVKLVIIANPNNPTGKYLTKTELNNFIDNLPADVVLVIDEAYGEYVGNKDYPAGLQYALSRPRTVILRTFSKVFGLAGLRLGYAIGDKNIINILCRIRDPFNVNSVVQEAAIAALLDNGHLNKSIQHNSQYLPILTQGLRDLGFLVTESVGNFVLAQKHPNMPPIKELFFKLLGRGVIIRPVDSYGLDDYARISVGTKDEINQLFSALTEILPNGR